MTGAGGTADHDARKFVLTGRVQGVGYRPFVYCTALELGITGWVRNGAGKVYIHAEGLPDNLERMRRALISNAPPLARPDLASCENVEVAGFDAFEIRASDDSTAPEIHIPPDLFTCNDCVGELTGQEERRFRYPFINCTQCGPRYTIITAMPYDRPNTSMAGFPLCEACREEYSSPLDRRFHAQPLACAECGPSLDFCMDGMSAAGNESALEATVDALHAGKIVAVKSVGGYHLVCDAANSESVRRLRKRKHRPHKPLAVMFPLLGSDGLDAVHGHTEPTAAEALALTDPSRPIVLVHERPDSGLAAELAPGLRELGIFLPYSPLHHRLLGEFGRPLVATSGNLSGEPVITDNAEAEQRLSPVCDAFLHHNRPIVRPADDPVVRLISSHPQVIRPGRGIAPIEMDLPDTADMVPSIAVGGHMKNTVALAWENRIVISPHIGELESPRSLGIFQRVIADLQELYGIRASNLICDAHPGYASARWAGGQAMPLIRVLHHHAHASALAGEHPDIDEWLVFTWDGVGYGGDGTLWGGEAFTGAPGRWRRAASFRPFGLVGGDLAGREPWRSAAALMWAEGNSWMPGIEGAGLARSGWHRNLGVHRTSAAGRLFDAAAALVLGREVASFEGQGPMELEALATDDAKPVRLPLVPDERGILRTDWAPLLPVLADETIAPGERAAIFHESMAMALAEQSARIREAREFTAVGLSGGVFQNRRLCESVRSRLEGLGIETRMHVRVPANDGGLCYGQVIEALAKSQTGGNSE
jgi:hydrogenase maturation protein HypF